MTETTAFGTLPGVADWSATFLPALGRSYYTDPGIFAREQERIFSARRFCAVRTSNLPASGEFRTCRAR